MPSHVLPRPYASLIPHDPEAHRAWSQRVVAATSSIVTPVAVPIASAPAHVAPVMTEEVRSPDPPTFGTGVAGVSAQQTPPITSSGTQLPDDAPERLVETTAAVQALLDLPHSSDDYGERWDQTGMLTKLLHYVDQPEPHHKPTSLSRQHSLPR